MFCGTPVKESLISRVQTDRQTGRETDRQRDRQADRHRERQRRGSTQTVSDI